MFFAPQKTALLICSSGKFLHRKNGAKICFRQLPTTVDELIDFFAMQKNENCARAHARSARAHARKELTMSNTAAMLQAMATGANTIANISSNAKARAFQREIYEHNKAWQQKTWDEDLRRYNETKMREDTAMQRTVADMRMAGINPATLSASATGGGASQSSPTQAEMLAYQQPAGYGLEGLTTLLPMLAEIKKTEAETKYIESQTEGKTIENEILADTKEWEKAKSAESLRELKATAWAKEIEANMAEILQQNNITKAELEKDLLYYQKHIAELTDKQANLFGILPGDSDIEKEAKMRKAYALINNYNGTTQEYIRAFAEAKRSQEVGEYLQDVANNLGGIAGTAIGEYGKRQSNYGKKEEDYRWEGKRGKGF